MKWLRLLGLVIVVAVAGLVVLVLGMGFAFDRSLARVYDVPLPAIAASTDSSVIERGRHLAGSVAGCGLGDCHGADLGGGRYIDLGPMGRIWPTNVTRAAAAYSDGELARLIQRGLKRDGRGVRIMTVHESNWVAEEDVVALVSYVRSMPPVDRPDQPSTVSLMGKVIDRTDGIRIDVARRIALAELPQAPAPTATAEYGAYVARNCMGCHGAGLSGGPIPGAPKSFAVPLNLTPHETGLEGWSFEDFERLIATGQRRDGRALDIFMPVAMLRGMDDTERRALWAYLQSLPPRPFGGR